MKKIGKMKVKELMKRKTAKIKTDESIKKVVQVFKRTNADALPVYSRDRFVGEIFQEDLLKLVVNVDKIPESRVLELGYTVDFGYFAKKAKDIMTENAISINENDLIEDAAWRMLENDVKSLIVENDKGKTVGMITEKDIIRRILKK